ncbi:MAG: hypothetical protein AB1641_19690 [Thermodesulfobacteriota bacterium]
MPIDTPHDVDLYALGRGVVWIATHTDGVIGTYVDVGNCTNFQLELSEERLDHYSYRTAVKQKDKLFVLESGYKINFDLDELGVQNMVKFLKGTLTANSIIRANQNVDAEWAVKFVSANASGPNYSVECWRLKLSPNGALSLIGDEYIKLSFSGEGLADETGHASSPQFDWRWLTTTTTSTTTSTTTTTAP